MNFRSSAKLLPDPRQLDPRQLDPRQLDPGQLDPGQLDPGPLCPQGSDCPPIPHPAQATDGRHSLPPPPPPPPPPEPARSER